MQQTRLVALPPCTIQKQPFFFFRSLCLRQRSINSISLLITATLLYINQALLYYLTGEIMTSSSNRSANQDHVLQQTGATPAGEGSLDKKVLIDVEVWSAQTSGSQKKKKNMLGIVFLFPLYLNFGLQWCSAVFFSLSKYSKYAEGKEQIHPIWL